ncbi:MAG: hypothetical protein IVW56_02160 [Candidatus Binataceae bacterium]|nr:hypothetical protein [Candidatus Binataceae bacterium]
MGRFALRHWTSILIAAALAVWAVFYLPDTPSYAVVRLKQTIDARDGNDAARYVDFSQVVRNAGYEMFQGQNGSAGGVIGELFGKGAVDLLSGPMAALLQSWAVSQVDDGKREVQMPAAAVAGAILFMHRSGDIAYTRWQDHKGQVYEVRMAREPGGWKIVEVKNVKQLLDKLKRQQEKQFNSATAPGAAPPSTAPGGGLSGGAAPDAGVSPDAGSPDGGPGGGP